MKNYLNPIAALVLIIVAFQALVPTPEVQAEKPLIEQVVQDGPGFFPTPPSGNCTCGDFAALEKRVAELERRLTPQAKPAASTTSGLPAGAVIVSERVVSSQPTVTYQSGPVLRQPNYQTGQPVRNVVRGVASGTCRIVNGVRVCN
jgi:hypothetical protein